jgi:hypothetical protein
MPTYLLSVCYPTGATAPDEVELNRIMADVEAVNSELVAAGKWVFGGGLHAASTATVVTDVAGTIVMTDGPFVESKEQLGGISVINAADLDEALTWASRLASAITVPIEVRPFVHGG